MPHNGTLPAAAFVKARDEEKEDMQHTACPCAWPRASMVCDFRCHDRELFLKTMEQITLENIITVANYIEALKSCRKAVGYKFSVQNYIAHGLFYIGQTINIIRSGKIPAVKNTEQVVISERGHKRVITPIRIEDRVTQRVLCDYVLVPLSEKKLIYDNGASVKGKGTDFSRRRVNEHIEAAKRKWGADNVYVLKFDFKSFFASIPHAQCFRVLDELIEDKRIRDLIMGIIESYQLEDIKRIKDPVLRDKEIKSLLAHEKVGICLGSQISQIMAILVPNDFDHFIKDKLGIEFYVRHMDDGIILLNNKDELVRIREMLREEAAKYGLTLHPKKTRIVKLTKGFTFLKIRYHVSRGKTIKTLVRSGIVRMRRKMKKFIRMIGKTRLKPDDVYASVQSWAAHARAAQSYHAVKNMIQLYDELFDGYRLTRHYWRTHKDIKRKRKVLRL